ncbi:hypothetical protein F6V25_12815 [Oryzomonas japonica]|uniref:Uncharacterized protein n=1 Tax=Oryzomonas japonica TaxID=2603858 RepID=A0A7J4ZPT1_9BACT|nr:hypothetical protein [Oryzomonas japonica]KAB0664417.1 hypothetical protein F6V25_12815 [Oryzomonas japonica]
MDINGISGNVVSPQTQGTALTPAASAAPAAATPEPAQPQRDTVELTGMALAKSLKLAGQNPAQIALKMGVDVKTVDSYLNIKATTATPAPQARPAPQTQQVAQTTAAAAQTFSPAEEATESAAQKTAETAQGKK